jgi:diaminohydroxyphosphoribosylaminopyrimidine deaminase/5-amino-6-(5-phosphoribosylamino)uracil reductase
MARGATAYVSLEPCSHQGRTAPCADALIVAGLERVVSAIEDPDPRVKGSGHARLRAAGLKVDTGLLAEEARRDLSGFLSRITRGRPHVLLKLARSSDGMIAEAPGQRTAITGEEANLRTHLMRAKADAIMVGIRTVRADDPHLACRLPGLEHRSPVPIVVDGGLTIEASSRLVSAAPRRALLILTTTDAPSRPDLEAKGVEIIRCRSIEPGRLDLNHGLEQLALRGIGRLLVEGGANLAGQLIDADLVDEIALYRSPKELGSQGVPGQLDLGGFRRTSEESLGADVLAHYEKC